MNGTVIAPIVGQMVAMADNWNFVAAGYLVTAAALGGYAAWLGARLRRARRAQPEETGD